MLHSQTMMEDFNNTIKLISQQKQDFKQIENLFIHITTQWKSNVKDAQLDNKPLLLCQTCNFLLNSWQIFILSNLHQLLIFSCPLLEDLIQSVNTFMYTQNILPKYQKEISTILSFLQLHIINTLEYTIFNTKTYDSILNLLYNLTTDDNISFSSMLTAHDTQRFIENCMILSQQSDTAEQLLLQRLFTDFKVNNGSLFSKANKKGLLEVDSRIILFERVVQQNLYPRANGVIRVQNVHGFFCVIENLFIDLIEEENRLKQDGIKFLIELINYTCQRSNPEFYVLQFIFSRLIIRIINWEDSQHIVEKKLKDLIQQIKFIWLETSLLYFQTVYTRTLSLGNNFQENVLLNSCNTLQIKNFAEKKTPTKLKTNNLRAYAGANTTGRKNIENNKKKKVCNICKLETKLKQMDSLCLMCKILSALGIKNLQKKPQQSWINIIETEMNSFTRTSGASKNLWTFIMAILANNSENSIDPSLSHFICKEFEGNYTLEGFESQEKCSPQIEKIHSQLNNNKSLEVKEKNSLLSEANFLHRKAEGKIIYQFGKIPNFLYEFFLSEYYAPIKGVFNYLMYESLVEDNFFFRKRFIELLKNLSLKLSSDVLQIPLLQDYLLQRLYDKNIQIRLKVFKILETELIIDIETKIHLVTDKINDASDVIRQYTLESILKHYFTGKLVLKKISFDNKKFLIDCLLDRFNDKKIISYLAKFFLGAIIFQTFRQGANLMSLRRSKSIAKYVLRKSDFGKKSPPFENESYEIQSYENVQTEKINNSSHEELINIAVKDGKWAEVKSLMSFLIQKFPESQDLFERECNAIAGNIMKQNHASEIFLSSFPLVVLFLTLFPPLIPKHLLNLTQILSDFVDSAYSKTQAFTNLIFSLKKVRYLIQFFSNSQLFILQVIKICYENKISLIDSTMNTIEEIVLTNYSKLEVKSSVALLKILFIQSYYFKPSTQINNLSDQALQVLLNSQKATNTFPPKIIIWSLEIFRLSYKYKKPVYNEDINEEHSHGKESYMLHLRIIQLCDNLVNLYIDNEEICLVTAKFFYEVMKQDSRFIEGVNHLLNKFLKKNNNQLAIQFYLKKIRQIICLNPCENNESSNLISQVKLFVKSNIQQFLCLIYTNNVSIRRDLSLIVKAVNYNRDLPPKDYCSFLFPLFFDQDEIARESSIDAAIVLQKRQDDIIILELFNSGFEKIFQMKAASKGSLSEYFVRTADKLWDFDKENIWFPFRELFMKCKSSYDFKKNSGNSNKLFNQFLSVFKESVINGTIEHIYVAAPEIFSKDQIIFFLLGISLTSAKTFQGRWVIGFLDMAKHILIRESHLFEKYKKDQKAEEVSQEDKSKLKLMILFVMSFSILIYNAQDMIQPNEFGVLDAELYEKVKAIKKQTFELNVKIIAKQWSIIQESLENSNTKLIIDILKCFYSKPLASAIATYFPGVMKKNKKKVE